MVPFSVKCDWVNGVFFVTGGGTIKCKMPSDIVSIVSTGLGVSMLAGILSGVCYVLAQGIIKKGRIRKKKSEWYCDICGTYLNSTANILNNDLVTCSKCGASVCSEKCSKFVQQTKWICKNCLKPSESWFKGILNAIQPSSNGISGIFGPIMNPQPIPDPDWESLRKLEKEQVRDFIEKLVNVMLGENVDNASVSMLYHDRQYNDIFDRFHQDLSKTLIELGSALHISMSNLPISGQSPCTAHAALKQLIEKLLREAVNLPLLEKAHAHPTTLLEDTTNKSYEDLLATAIINKVVSSCQNNLPSSSANSVSSRLSNSSRNKDDKEYFFGEETLDRKWKTTDLDTTSISSLEDWMQSESSFGSRKYVDKVTLMIKQDIEEVDNFDSDDDEDDAEYFRSSSSLCNDSESNWFLQKRNFQGAHSPVPVPMLVPNPSSDVKVLIGDKPLDDTSDLSDVGSDYEEPEPAHSPHSLLLQSKNIIGGGKGGFEVAENGDEHSESSTDSGVKEVNGKEQKSFDMPESLKTDITVDDDNVEDSSFTSIYSNTEKEAEYTERYGSLPKQIIKNSSPEPSFKTEDLYDKPEENNESIPNSGDFEYVGGSYSKKEKEKWKHAIEMKNNPYSKENIEKRIKRSHSASSDLFGPDYYAKLAKKPSGAGKLISNEINGVSWPPRETSRSRTPSPVPKLPKVPPPLRPIETTSNHSVVVKSSASIDFSQTESNRPPKLPKVPPPLRPIETTLNHSVEVNRSSASIAFSQAESNHPPKLPKVPPPLRPIEPTLNHSLELNLLSESIDFFDTESNRPPKLPKKGPPPKGSIEIDGIHQAIQAIVTPVDENMPDNSFESQVDVIIPEKKPQLYRRGNYTVETNNSEFTSDSDLSYVNFYDVEHSQIVRKTKNEDIHNIPITATPLGVSYRSIADENGNNDGINYNEENITSNVEDHIDMVLKETPVAKPRIFAVQTKAEHIQTKGEHVETKAEHVQTRTEHVQTRTAHVQSKTERVQSKSEHVQTNTTIGQVKSQNGLYIKATFADKHRHLSQTTEKPALRRNLSESSLLEQSFDSAPKVMHHKRDNTIISRIYKDPKVRLFALHSREEVPGGDGEHVKTAYRSQLSLDSKLSLSESSSMYVSKGRSYNSSDDGHTSEYESGKTGKMSFFSSEEDLLSINSDDGLRNNNVVSTKNEGIKLVSVENKSNEVEITTTPNYAITPRSTNLNKKFIYGSQEDLLSIDEVGSIPKRKDNTIISKIYKNANVRNFALQTHGDNIPDHEVVTTQKVQQKVSSSDEEHYHNNNKTLQKRTVTHKKIYSSYDDLSSADISLEVNINHAINHQNYQTNLNDEHIKNQDSEDGYKSEDMDIGEVAKRHVVRDTLGRFSRSEVDVKSSFVRSSSMEESEGIRVSVRDLKKKFESEDTGTKPVISSLTARSISKQVKESLKQ